MKSGAVKSGWTRGEMTLLVAEFSWSQVKVFAERLGRKPAAVARKAYLLKLDPKNTPKDLFSSIATKCAPGDNTKQMSLKGIRLSVKEIADAFDRWVADGYSDDSQWHPEHPERYSATHKKGAGLSARNKKRRVA